MENIELQAEAPRITFLNLSGDVTITWDKANEKDILALVEQKMKEGFSFFVIKPRVLGLFGSKKVAITSTDEARRAGKVVVNDATVYSLLPNVHDAAIAEVISKGHARLTKPVPKEERGEVQRVTVPAEVLRHQTLAIRRVVGG